MEDNVKALEKRIAQIQRDINNAEKQSAAALSVTKKEGEKANKQEEIKSYARGIADGTKRLKAEEAWLAKAKKEFDKMYDAKLKEEALAKEKKSAPKKAKGAKKVSADAKKQNAPKAEKIVAKKESNDSLEKDISAEAHWTKDAQPALESEIPRNDIYGYREISFEEDSLLGEDHDFLMEEEEETVE